MKLEPHWELEWEIEWCIGLYLSESTVVTWEIEPFNECGLPEVRTALYNLKYHVYDIMCVREQVETNDLNRTKFLVRALLYIKHWIQILKYCRRG